MSQKDKLNISAELVFFDKKTKIRLISEETLETLNCCADLWSIRMAGTEIVSECSKQVSVK